MEIKDIRITGQSNRWLTLEVDYTEENPIAALMGEGDKITSATMSNVLFDKYKSEVHNLYMSEETKERILIFLVVSGTLKEAETNAE